jgi:pimeloyl-ACP methyl ester carboxylesterase
LKATIEAFDPTARDVTAINVDFVEAGAGPTVVLVHSSVSGARQWRRLIEDLRGDFRVRAVNLFGYGETPTWPRERAQSLADQALLVEAALPEGDEPIALVGHSFGGAVAMKVAARSAGRVTKLALLEANPFYLLKQAGRVEAYAEAAGLRDWIKQKGADGAWRAAAERFSDYWTGPGSWDAMSADRQSAFTEALKPNYSEWDAVMNETTSVEKWATLLPRDTLFLHDPATVFPIREIAVLFRQACPHWRFAEIAGGHMAPLVRPDLVNPVVKAFLKEGVRIRAASARVTSDKTQAGRRIRKDVALRDSRPAK